MDKYENCINNKHHFRTITSYEDDFEGGEAVRWCTFCGVIRIDRIYDGRTVRQGTLSLPTTFTDRLQTLRGIK